jgi:hypothetical protein
MMFLLLKRLSAISALGKALIRSLGCICCSLLLAVPAFAVPTATTTALSVTSGGSSVTTVTSGSVVTLIASVNSTAGAVTTGQVNFCDATATYCTDVHLLGTSQLTSAGVATLKFIPGIGNHSYKAVFVGTNVNLPSSSSASQLAVTGTFSSTTTIASSGSAGNYTLMSTVSGAGVAAPTGTVSFVDTSDSDQVLGTAPLGNGTQGLNFANVSTSATGTAPFSVVAADFNGDGKLDLITLNGPGAPANNSLTLLLGNGDGTFTQGTAPATTFSPGSIAVGDFNADGKPDLAVASAAANSFTVLLGNGDGTFTPAASLSTAGPNSLIGPIFAGDFNGDGKVDLAIVGQRTFDGEPYTVTAALGNGDGTFTAAPASQQIGEFSSFAVGDFNGDGRPDVVGFDSESFGGSVYLSNSDGTFTPASGSLLVPYPSSIAVGDFNGDGNLDLAVESAGATPAVVLLLGVGDGTFTAGATITVPSTGFGSSFVVGDFNNDGKPDLGWVSQQGVLVLEGKGDGTFTLVQNTFAGSTTQAISAGDFNGDGLPDLAVTNGLNGSGNSVSVLIAQSAQATATVNGISSIGTGTHQVQASYAGDGTYGSSVSQTIGLTALPTTTLTLATNPASTSFGQQMVLSATLSPFTAQSQSTDGESITFFNGSVSVGTGKLASGVATLNLTSLPAGTRSLHAVYGGDANLAPSTSNTVSSIVLPAGTTTTFALSNQNLTLTATVAPATSGVPTGTVSFFEGQTVVGTGTLSNGVASYTATSFPTGNVVLSAQYGGDANFTQSTSPSISVLSVAPTSTSLTVSQAGSVTDTVNLSSAPGYSGTTQLSCSNLPQFATCTFVPSFFLFAAGSNSGSATLTIQTGASAQGALRPLLPGSSKDKFAILATVIWLPGLLATAITGRGRKTGTRMDRLSLLLVLCCMTAGLTACSGPSSGSSGGTGLTPAGTYAMQVVATGPTGLSQTTNVNLTVH